MLLKNPREGQQMKRRYEENIGLHEMFLESVPTVFIMTILLFKAIGKILMNSTTHYSHLDIDPDVHTLAVMFAYFIPLITTINHFY